MVPGALVSTTTWIGSIDFATKVKYGPLKQFRLFWPFYYSCTLNSRFFFILVVKQLHACTTVLMKQNLWQEYCLESFWLWMPNVGKIVEHRLVSRYVFLQDFLVPAVWNKKNRFFELHWICTLWMRFDQILPIFKFKSILCDLKTSKRVFFSKSTLIWLLKIWNLLSALKYSKWGNKDLKLHKNLK